VKTSWSWLLNNRDDQLDLKLIHPDRLVARRGYAGMKLFHLGGGTMQEPIHAYVHDAYHPRPNQLGEGKPGSGVLMRWTEKTAATARTIVHAIALDDPGTTARWQLDHAPDATRFTLTETVSGKNYTIAPDSTGVWHLTA
jgi:hypothetical protein